MSVYFALFAFLAYACASLPREDYKNLERESYVNLAMCRLGCMEPLPRSCNQSSVDACTAACNYCWRLCQNRRGSTQSRIKPEVSPGLHDLYAMHGTPRFDVKKRQLTWGRLLRYGASTNYRVVDVGCVEPVLYLVFSDRPVKESNPYASERSHMQTFMMQNDLPTVPLNGLQMSRDTGKSIVFDILAVTSKCGVVDTLQLEYPLPEDTSVVREYQGSIWRSSWTDLIAFWGVIAMCAILMIFALAPLVSHIIRERLERRQLMASVVMTESSSWNRRSSRVYSETAL